jgi:lysophospholipase L1-like esterase
MWRSLHGRRGAAPITPFAASALLLAACGSNIPSVPLSSSAASATQPESAAASASARPSASAEAAPGWRLVAIGDSLARTTCGGCANFVDLYAKAITEETGVAVQVDNRSAIHLSKLPPIQVDVLRDQILTDPSLRAAIADADIIVVDVGFNDTPWNRYDNPCEASDTTATVVQWDKITAECIARVTHETKRTLDEIFTQIDNLRGCARPPDPNEPPNFCSLAGGSDTVLRLVTVYNDWIGWVDAPPEATEPSALADRAIADAQCWVVEVHGGLCVDAYALLNGPSGTEDAGPYLAEDHTHLDLPGHQRIAEALAALGVDPLTP